MAVQQLGNGVFTRIREDILSLKLSPGEVITERLLQSSYGVSRTPIRQALTELVREGHIIKFERSYAVAPFDLHRLKEIFEYREWVEDAAIRLGCERARSSEIDAIQAAVDRDLFNAPLTNSLDFHVQLAALSRNRCLREAVLDVANRTRRARSLNSITPEMLQRAHYEHSEILLFVRERRAEEAASALRRHARDSWFKTMQAVEEKRGLFGRRGVVEELLATAYSTF